MESSSADCMVDSILRAVCAETGSSVGAVTTAVTTKPIQEYEVLDTCPLA